MRELALSHGRSGPIGARVCCTCSANHDFRLPRRTGPRRRAAHNGKRVHGHALSYLVSIYLFISFVLQLGCAGTDEECLTRALALSLVEVLLVTGGARGAFPLALLGQPSLFALPLTRRSIHRLSTHMERRAPLSSKHRCPTNCAGMHGRGSRRERKNESAAGASSSSLTGSCCNIMQFFATMRVCFTAPAPPTTASDGRTSPSPSSSRGTHFSFISFYFLWVRGPERERASDERSHVGPAVCSGVFITDTSADATTAAAVVVVVTRV
ncbi:hypothetical protein EDB85DRAFT_1102582 [Lactarius pseudohatsudake]|nr:hypothetical protein EDB85DRAFT_1102582 [Lactarius pseudohatsudake]